jgi:hypothetical protein
MHQRHGFCARRHTIANRKAFYDNRMSLQRDPKLIRFSEAHIQEDLGNAKQPGNDTIIVFLAGLEADHF